MKKCPYCAEEIQDEATKCRFCGEYLNKKKKWKNCFLGCLATFAVSFALIFIFTYLSLLIFRLILHRVLFGMPHVLPHYYPPFSGQGLEGILREFSEALRALWERLMDFLRSGSQNQRLTF